MSEHPAPPQVPVVAIVGRPNVGKSTLLNALVRTRVAIVEPSPGVTRDRVGVLTTLDDRPVEVVDTGGVGIVDLHGLDPHVEAQVAKAIEQAAVILFVVDVREGRTPLDERVAGMLRGVTDRVMLLANKAESERHTWNLADFAPLGYGEVLPISAQEGHALRDLIERIVERLPEDEGPAVDLAPPEMQLALVGRVNAGKSSLVNRLLSAERMIVSETPGTTRDSVDLRFERDGLGFVIIDTAGIRKERRVHGSVEFYAQRRAEKAMRRADVTALVLDVTRDVGRLDRQIAGYAVKGYHPVVIVANKWDLRPPEMNPEAFTAYLDEVLGGLRYAPIVYASALDGTNVERLVEVGRSLHQQAQTRVPTARMNEVIERAYALRKPRPRHGKMGRIYYASQVDVGPPTFVLFVNDPALFNSSYIRFLENRFREALPMPEIPVRIVLRARERSPSKYQ